MKDLNLISQKWTANDRMTVIRALTNAARLQLHHNEKIKANAILAMIEVMANPQHDKHHLESKRTEIESMLKME